MEKRPMAGMKIEFATATPDDFMGIYSAVIPMEIAVYYRVILHKKNSELFGEAAKKLNDSKKPSISQKDLYNSLVSTLASEIWKKVSEDEKKRFFSNARDSGKENNSQAYEYFKKTLELLREDKH